VISDPRRNLGKLGEFVATREPAADEALSPIEHARVREMEEEIRRLRMENEFLTKAAAFFVRTQP
jgi:transposase